VAIEFGNFLITDIASKNDAKHGIDRAFNYVLIDENEWIVFF